MSTLLPTQLDCSACGVRVHLRVVVVGNMARHPTLRTEAAAGRLNAVDCPACGHTNRVARTSVLVDLARREWLHMWPRWAEVHWQDLAGAVAARFERVVYGIGGLPDPGPREAWTVRSLFGAAQLAECLRVLDAGLDPVAVERAKLVLLQGRPQWAHARLLLIGVADDVLAWQVRTASGEDLVISTASRLLDADWPSGFLPGPLGADAYVNHRRFFLTPVAADPLAFDLTGTRATPTSRDHFR